MGILALDQSLSGTGFALLPDDGSPPVTGSWTLCDGVRNRDIGFRELWGHLDRLHKGSGFDAILYEEPISGKTDKTSTRIALFGLVAIIELFSVSRNLPTVSYHPNQWRSSFFSNEERRGLTGKAWKHAAIDRMRQFGFDPITHDEAEAFGILDHHLMICRMPNPWREEHPFLEALA